MPNDNDSISAPFLGTGWSFPPAFNRAVGGVSLSKGEKDVEESLRILLSTAAGERLMQPAYGCDLRGMLFEPMTTTGQTYLSGLIETAVLHFEPRVFVNGVTLDADRIAEGFVTITIDYTIRSTNSRYNLVYPFYLEYGEARTQGSLRRS